MMRTRRPLSHPLADVFWRAVDSIATSLSPDTVRGYRAVTRSFLRYLGADHHEIRSLKQLRRDPHILGWLAHLRSRTPPIVLATHVNNVVRLRHILEELAWNEQMPDLAHLPISWAGWPTCVHERHQSFWPLTSTMLSACDIFLKSWPGTNRCPTWRICSVMTIARDAKERYRAR